ncbi:inorganic diphosphatase [Chitinophaga oryzae]|uniref:inorganic diphosphatase n=1 Tax=Chitinophaga oryzae TaxID=2725414 RepID=A0AAE6ZD16_9BACT|nr:inorganic diphosphatase [Chitinophaga oryzae]QJB30379.1 inorganic diphosphatase [Chitinophaga oryzae]QJB36888.1 inorganic diphosphatase [Chitinophaga oryzae]
MIIKELHVVIETPKGSSEKYDFDPVSRFFVMSQSLPAGMMFPFDMGFIPGTRAEDGNPLDVMVLSEFKTFTGCMIKCRLIGAIKAIVHEPDGMQVRWDRYIAVPFLSRVYKELDVVPDKLVRELEGFFAAYHGLEGRLFKPAGYLDAAPAYEQIKFV